MNETLLYKVALSLIPGIGSVLARNLISNVGSIEGIFREKPSRLMKIPGIGEVNARRIIEARVMEQASHEIEFIEKNQIRTYFYLDDDYPKRFTHCTDAPILFYFKGKANFNCEKAISIVGTRNATTYGRQMCDELLKSLSEKEYKPLIVSGLAYGIDIQAHKSALKYNLPTIGVVGHGLDRLYPSAHQKIAADMLGNGGILTDFPSQTKIEAANFIRRNRLIAGLADATIVIESGEKGGALITADIASSYNRDVLAYPGRCSDPYSKGCNRLIKRNIAAMIESSSDLEYQLGWEKSKDATKPIQQVLFQELSTDEKKITDLLQEHGKTYIDLLANYAEFPVQKLSNILISLEFKGLINVFPGKMYQLK
jgi:DNA processing protein